MTNSSARTALVRHVVGALAALFVLGTVAGCGGRQAPPTEGTCHAWRRWARWSKATARIAEILGPERSASPCAAERDLGLVALDLERAPRVVPAEQRSHALGDARGHA